MGEATDTPAELAQQAFGARDWRGVVEALASVDPDAPGEDGDHLLLLRAEARRRLGDDPVAVRDDILAAVRLAGRRADRLVRAARMLRHLGDVAGALAVARAAHQAAPEEDAPRRALAEILVPLGREREAVVLLEEDLDPARQPHRALDAARLRLSRHDGAGAARWAEAVVAESADPATGQVARGLACDARLVMGDSEGARRWIDDAMPPEEALRRALDVGDLPLAEAAIRRLDGPARPAWTARLALWRGDLDTAMHHATLGAEVPLAALVRVAVRIEQGTADRNEITRAVEAQHGGAGLLADRPAALAWRAEAARRAGAPGHARAEGQAAQDAEGRYLLAGHLVMLRAHDRSIPAVTPHDDPDAAVVAHALPAEVYWSGPDFDASAEATALAALIGPNRSRWPTARRADGTLVRVHPAPVPLHGMRPLQGSLYVRDPEEVRAEVAILRTRHPHDPTMMTYGAEIDLWLGRYEDALAASEEALGRCRTQKWAWVGLGASRMFCGDLQGALDAFAEGAEVTGGDGPSAYVYRGETLWRLGRVEDAVEDLTEAVRRTPTRVGGWLLWARAHLALGDPKPAANVLQHLRATAPGAWLDLVRHVGASASPADQLDGMLALMHGNRSSALPTYLADGFVRGITWEPPRRARRRSG